MTIVHIIMNIANGAAHVALAASQPTYHGQQMAMVGATIAANTLCTMNSGSVHKLVTREPHSAQRSKRAQFDPYRKSRKHYENLEMIWELISKGLTSF